MSDFGTRSFYEYNHFFDLNKATNTRIAGIILTTYGKKCATTLLLLLFLKESLPLFSPYITLVALFNRVDLMFKTIKIYE